MIYLTLERHLLTDLAPETSKYQNYSTLIIYYNTSSIIYIKYSEIVIPNKQSVF